MFPDTQGGFLRRSNFTRQVWHPIRTASGIPETVTFHDLRHTHATLLIEAGEHIKVVSSRLGHKSVAFTLDTYVHVTPKMASTTAERLDAVLG